ncbi:MAG TPA: hypothetical protein VIC33_00545, partial [Vicinamibacterales bacterium]
MRRCLFLLLLLPLAVVVVARTSDVGPQASDLTHLTDPFSAGWMLTDTNGNGLADAIHGHIVVPAEPSAVENAAAADFGARVAYGSTGLTLPLVISADGPGGHEGPPLRQEKSSPDRVGAGLRAGAEDAGPHIWIGRAAIPVALTKAIDPLVARMAVGEGGVFAMAGDLAVVGKDEAGLLAAAEAYASHAPYQWKTPGDELAKIAAAVNAAFTAHKVNATAALVGVTYENGKEGIRRAFLRVGSGAGLRAGPPAIRSALARVHLDQVRELVLLPASGPAITVQANREAPHPTQPTPGGTDRHRLDLATLYTINGLFGGSPKMPVPASLDGRLYVPAGAAGVAMANLAARMGLESTGITIPLAFPAAGVTADKLTTQSVVAGDSALAQAIEQTLEKQAPGWASRDQLQAGEGVARVVDDALGTQPKEKDAPAKKDAILVRGDAQGSAAAIDLLAGHFPNLWEVGKQYLSLEEVRYDLHRFFSLRSGAGQAAVALYHLDRWMNEIAPAGQSAPAVSHVEAEVYVDRASPGLDTFIQHAIEQRLHVANVAVKTGSLHAGTQCCADNPPLHDAEPGYPFRQAQPTFSEDITIPWEGNTLLNDVREAVGQGGQGGHEGPPLRESESKSKRSGLYQNRVGAGLRAGPIVLEARVSEGPQERGKLQRQLESMLTAAGAAP